MYTIIGVKYTIFGEKYTILSEKYTIFESIRFLRLKVYDYKGVKYAIFGHDSYRMTSSISRA